MKLFIDDLSETGKLEGVKYTFWDERFTSKVGASNHQYRGNNEFIIVDDPAK